MSKETMIIFVYDLTKKVENDDPTGSIIYFHPMWVSELQKKSLCGQLMGSTYFLGETLAKVRFIALQNGKFALRPHGRFMLAVGSDRNVPDSILEYRANLLSTLIELFHGNFNTLYNVFVEKEQKNGFNEKVFCVMESCLPMLQFNGNIFQNMPSLRLPKCASNIYLESNQVLQSFLQNKGVLGGSIFFHNKVLVSQLPTNLTKLLVYSDPYRVKIAETINVTFHVPNGVSLISAYIPKRDYTQLVEATKNIPIYFNNGSAGAATNGGSGPPVPAFAIKKKLIPSKELGGPLGGLKSDKSIIFSHIPEEESVPAEGGVGEAAGVAPRKPFNVSRPTFLPLKFKNLTSRDIIDSGVNSINFDESDSFPNFIGKTSVVSTPLTENKIVPNRNMMSICVTQDKPTLEQSEDNTNPGVPNTTNEEAKITKEGERESGSSMFKQINSGVPMKYDAIFSNPLLLSTKKYHAISLSTLNEREVDEQDDSTVSEDDTGDEQRKKRMSLIHRLISKNYSALKTVADPLYPIVDQRKRAMSFSLFQDIERLRNEHLAELVEQEEEQKDRESQAVPEEAEPPVASKSEIDAAESIISKPADDTATQPPITPLDRRGLSLPIKSFNLNDDHQPNHHHRSTGVGGSTELFTRRKSTLELTPLMTKLTVLAANDPESSGVSSWDTTPGCSYNMAISPQEYIPQRRKSQDIQQQQLSTVNGAAREDDDKPLVKVELFVCVQQNMTLVLVMQEKNCKNQRLVQTLFESCVSKFLRIENDIQLAMNINVDGYDKAEGYSLIALDSDWDVAKKSGPWSMMELQTTESLHTHFRKSNLVTEVTLKSQDSVLYGYQCGMRELFYTQIANAQSGLPPPQDVMGSVPLCAKRRIERDHFALLL
ncbi:hypothetical protein AND_006701 [Anopheles darlingi]|uniref:CCZ1/INTU/HSP4 first Longin domain-containing protein n=1 Tax=Anopheles darlingi TaxID=43151 RepID=W5JFP4_ANODA|nr:hypothetical protein AND_006701 [Anopheles darlingi]